MVRHVILWKLKDSEGNTEKIKSDAKENLEALVGKIDGLEKLELNISPCRSSNCDMMLDSLFESEAALKAYQTHPAHAAAADKYVRPFAEKRLCFDFEC